MTAVEELFQRYGPSYRWFVTATVMLGMMSTILTATMINVAIPVIMGAFGIGQDTAHWLATGFLAAMTVGMLLNAWTVRRFGARVTFLGALAVFIAGALLGGTSPDADLLIFARVLQGAGAGILQPLSMVLIFQVFPASHRGRAMGIFGLGIVLAPAMGPAVGGILVDAFNWRYVFFMAVPFAGLAAVLGSVFMPGRDADERPDFDWLGFVLVTLTMTCLLTSLSNGQSQGWHSPAIVLQILVVLVAGGLFIWWQLVTPQPLLQVRLFASSRFLAAAIIGAARGAGLFGTTYLIPLFVQTIQGYTPTRSGLLMVPAGIVMMIMFPIAGRLSDRFPTHLMLIAGLFLFGLSSLLMTGADTHTAFWTFAFWLIISRFGMALIVPTLNVTAMRTVPPDMLNHGSSAFNFMRQLGGSLGVNAVAITLERRTALFSDAFTAMQTAANDATGDLVREFSRLLAQAGWPADMQVAGTMHFLGQTLHTQANMLGFRDGFMVMAVLFFVTMLPAWYMGRTTAVPGQLAATAR